MKKIIILSILTFVIASCSDNLTDLNSVVKNAATVQGGALYSNAQKNLVDEITSANVNQNIFRLLTQQWTQTTYTDESKYDLVTRNIPQNFWNVLYRDVLRDLKEAKDVITADTDPDHQSAKVNQLALIEITSVYTWSVLVNTYGNIPYTEALDYKNVHPKYDDAATVYYDLLKRLDDALAVLDPKGDTFGEEDLLYGGNIAAWKLFANSLKLKLGMIIADVDPAKAKTIVLQAAPNSFTSNKNNAIFEYLNSPPNTNPIWVDLIQSGRKDFVAANTLVNKMNSLNDPRREFYFTTVDSTSNGETYSIYKGGKYGASNNYYVFSAPSDKITDASFNATLLDYSEVEFLLAEAVERGMSVGGTAAEHYNKAIAASIAEWGGSDVAIAEYLAQPSVSYPTAGASWKQKIGTQKWLALYNRGYDAWTEQRRLDYPVLIAPTGASLPSIPVRLTYPVQEQNLNVTNYNQAATAIGSDVAATKLFWDKQ